MDAVHKYQLVAMDVSKWSILSLLAQDFVCQIKLVCVFGNLGNEVLIVTKSDEVYALGTNTTGCHGTGDRSCSLFPRKVDVLCGKGVISFAYGSGPHVLALTETGELYSWGHNNYCELGNGSTGQGLVPSLVGPNISGKKVIEIACGSHHSMALTADGEVYAWGQNSCGQIGSGMSATQATPRKVTACIGNKSAIAIACGQTSSVAILDSGEVYCWGYNGNGQLGLGNSINQLNPCRLTVLQGVVIVRVVCGYAHTLALSDEGVLYAWGCNSYGQLGLGNMSNLVTPTKVDADLGRVLEIAASHYNHISAAVTQSSKVYMWGQCKGISICSPIETPFTNLHDVFACFAIPSVMWRPMEVEPHVQVKVTDSLKMAFDDQEDSDIAFKIDSQHVYVHKAVLKIRCQHFRSMFQDHWIEDSKEVIEVNEYSYLVYRAFLKYLYTDEVDLPPESVLELLVLANAYCEEQLKKKCIQMIKQGITVSNTAMLYSTAIQYNAKELEEFCFRFALNHMTAVIQTEAFGRLDEATLKNFICKAAQHGAFKS